MRVWVQQGHVPRTSGSTGTSGEQDYVRDIAGRVANLLQGRHTIKLALADEPIAGKWDMFVALHCDGSTSSTASGASVGYRNTAGQNVARLWKARYQQRGWPHGFRADNYTSALEFYYGTGWARDAGIHRAFILEHGFLTNPTKDRAWLTSTDGRRAAAAALADVVTMTAGEGPHDLEDDMPTTDEIVKALVDPAGIFLPRLATVVKDRVLEALANRDGELAIAARQQIAQEVWFRVRKDLNLHGEPAESVNGWLQSARAAQHAHGAHETAMAVLDLLEQRLPATTPAPTPPA